LKTELEGIVASSLLLGGAVGDMETTEALA
jgi:hypothetical protein